MSSTGTELLLCLEPGNIRPGKQGGHTNHNKLPRQVGRQVGRQSWRQDSNLMHMVINHGKNKVETNDLF